MKVKTTITACFSIFRISTEEGLQYRLAALAGVTVSILWAFIEILVLTVFYRFGNASASGAMSLVQAVSYQWIGQLTAIFTWSVIHPDIYEDIRNGNISIALCRPMSLYNLWLAKTASGKAVTLLLRGFTTFLFGAAFPGEMGLSLPVSPGGFLLFLISLGAAFCLAISFCMLMTAVRVNVEWGDGPINILIITSGLLSGIYLPLQLWPDFMQKFLLFQPFAGYADIPARLYVGTISLGDGLFAIGLQIVWAAAFVMGGRLIMRRKLKKIIVQGG